jgi:hypothetical protein
MSGHQITLSDCRAGACEELPGAMVITVGHIGPLQQLHDAQLELRRCG